MCVCVLCLLSVSMLKILYRVSFPLFIFHFSRRHHQTSRPKCLISKALRSATKQSVGSGIEMSFSAVVLINTLLQQGVLLSFMTTHDNNKSLFPEETFVIFFMVAIIVSVHQGAETRLHRPQMSSAAVLLHFTSTSVSVILSSKRPFIETFLSVFYFLLFSISPPE